MSPLGQYEQLVDRNAHRSRLPIHFAKETFYGQLTHILVVHVQAMPTAIPPTSATTLVLAVIHACDILRAHPALDIHYYKNLGRTEVVDITTVQCVVGRVRDRGQWAIIDRSGSLSRALYVEDDN